MTTRRRALAIGGGVAGTILLFVILVPFLFGGRITALVETEVDRRVEAEVSWGDVRLSFLRTFPNLGLALEDLSVVGIDRFAGDTLAAMERLSISVELGSALRVLRGGGPLVVRSVRLEAPVLRLRVPREGEPSWAVLARDEDTVPVGEEEPPAGLAVELRSFEVVDGRVLFDDARSGLLVSLDELQHTLSGDFSRDSLVATTSTRAERTTLVFAGTPYLPGVVLGFDADLTIRTGEGRIALRDNELRLNELRVRFAGEVARTGESLDLDLRLETPETDFRQILSLVPAVHAQDFASLETEGRFALSGDVRGRYGPDAFPAFGLRATVEDGSFRYPDLPLPARAIAADLAIDNPGGDADSTVVRLSRFHVEIGDQPLDATVTVRTPVSDPDVAADVRGTLDLAALGRTVKLPDVDELSGLVTADARGRARRSDLDSARYEQVVAEGTVTARDAALSSAALRQPVTIEEMALTLSPERADLDTFRARLGSSDVEATGGIDNLLGFVMRDEPLRGSGRFHSDRFVLDEWKSDDELQAIPVPAILDLTLEGTVDRLAYGTLDMTDAGGSLRVRDERLTMDGFSFSTLGGRIAVTGHYETTDPARPTFGIDLGIDSVDVAGAAAQFLTVRTLAPVARYAQGTFSSELELSGALDEDMTPVLDVLDGAGSLLTSRIAIQGFPVLQRLAGLVPVPGLDSPTFNAVRSSIRIEDGRLHVEPFDVSVAGLTMTVAGSNGIDQSLDYRLSMAVPRGLLGGAADRLIRDLGDRAGRAGASFAAGETIPVEVGVGGTVQDPALDLALGSRTGTARQAVEDAAGAAVDRQVEEAREQVDQAAEEARRRAAARADSIVAAAEARAETIRAEARRAAEQVRTEGNRRADEVLAQATNPIARAAAEPLADRIRREAEERAEQIEREANERADALVDEAREQAARIREGG